ncbi:2-oxoglutarate-dependent dioxygenase AOP1.2 [Actinidia chinensis var. chinensis]|uniref:2-oxoglutarate-dependent dioxygenase AOP1.2 n=1 Tax=Actinidia chinensis var. chinensis TaxID=1590841 RepID=A0A2R6QZT1_ACTCC|nr:2-oxoglutarate-dependent dioxygenase AOP1.2 [Actinidia chinensis var. chinensis]
MGSLTQPNLPVIDFSMENLKCGADSWAFTANKVVLALEEYGCFIATYDKVSLDLHNAIFHASKELFDLPTETKIKNTSKIPSHGYVGQEPIIPLYEGLGIENPTTVEGVQTFTNLMWPSGNDFFCETTLLFSRLVAELDQMVMRMVSESYRIENDYETVLESTTYLLRLIKYRERQTNETNLGIVPHTDKSFMSILHQRQVKGLEIKTKDGDWILIEPSPSSFIVMAGDACMAWTNGRIEPPSHRVIMRGSEERYSLGLFTFFGDRIIQIPKELVDDKHPLQFKPFDHYKFIDFYYTDEGRKSKCPIKDYCGV